MGQLNRIKSALALLLVQSAILVAIGVGGVQHISEKEANLESLSERSEAGDFAQSVTQFFESSSYEDIIPFLSNKVENIIPGNTVVRLAESRFSTTEKAASDRTNITIHRHAYRFPIVSSSATDGIQPIYQQFRL